MRFEPLWPEKIAFRGRNLFLACEAQLSIDDTEMPKSYDSWNERIIYRSDSQIVIEGLRHLKFWSNRRNRWAMPSARLDFAVRYNENVVEQLAQKLNGEER